MFKLTNDKSNFENVLNSSNEEYEKPNNKISKVNNEEILSNEEK